MTQISSLNVSQLVTGVTQLSDVIFIIHSHTNAVLSFNQSFFQLGTFNVSALRYPNDMSASVTNQCIYVADYWTGCVWKVTLEHQVQEFAIQQDASTLSVTTDGRVYVITSGGSTMTLFNQDGEVIQAYNLDALGYNSTQHIVETYSGNWILAQADSVSNIHRIYEVDCQGSLINSYGSHRGSEPGQLNLPVHIALDHTSGRVFVADARNYRVLMFDVQLRLLSVVLTVADSNLPWRLSLDSSTLVVGLTGKGTVRVYNVCPSTSNISNVTSNSGQFNGEQRTCHNLKRTTAALDQTAAATTPSSNGKFITSFELFCYI